MNKRFAKLSKAEQENVETEYHRMKREDFDETMARANTHRVHENTLKQREESDNELAQMAGDPDIQRELREIEREFSPADSDGLGIA